MNVKVGVVLGAALLAACGSGKATTAKTDARATTTTRPLEIAGLRPGMPASQVRPILEAAGWKVEAFPGEDWNEFVRHKADIRLRKPITIRYSSDGVQLFRARKGEEDVYATISPTPQGGQVKVVGYRAPQAGRSLEQIRSEIAKRYGPLPYSRGEKLYGDPKGEDPALELVLNSEGMKLTLNEGGRASNAWQAMLDRAVNEKVGAVGSSY